MSAESSKSAPVQSSVGESPSLFLGEVENDGKSGKWIVHLRHPRICQHKKKKYRVDTGADVSVMTEAEYRELDRPPKLNQTNIRLHSVSAKLVCLGTFVTILEYNGIEVEETVYVVRDARNNLLCGSTAEKLGIIACNVHEVVIPDSAFGELGLMDCEPLKLEVKEGSVPYSISAPRRIPLPLVSKVQDELKRMEAHGIIEPVNQATEYCAPLVVVQKRDGDSVRLCVDLKRLNENLVKQRHWMPTIEEIMPKLTGMTVFSKLDASSGFWSIPLHPDSRNLTTFLTPFGRYRFCRMPFGVTVGPEVYQQKMDELLQGIPGVANFVDDTIVAGKTQAEHDRNLAAVLSKIEQSGLKLNKKKCEFSQPSLEFLGHTIDSKGIRPSESKVKAILAMPSPTNKSELKRALGMVNYLGRYLPNLSTILAPLNVLLRDSTAWA